MNIAVMKAKRLQQRVKFAYARPVVGADPFEEFAQLAGLAGHVILPYRHSRQTKAVRTANISRADAVW